MPFRYLLLPFRCLLAACHGRCGASGADTGAGAAGDHPLQPGATVAGDAGQSCLWPGAVDHAGALANHRLQSLQNTLTLPRDLLVHPRFGARQIVVKLEELLPLGFLFLKLDNLTQHFKHCTSFRISYQ